AVATARGVVCLGRARAAGTGARDGRALADRGLSRSRTRRGRGRRAIADAGGGGVPVEREHTGGALAGGTAVHGAGGTVSASLDAALLARAHRELNAKWPGSRAFWLYDLDAVRARAETLKQYLKDLSPRLSYALKANGLPAIARTLREAGLGADAGSLGELELARACGYPAGSRTLSGNGRTPE